MGEECKKVARTIELSEHEYDSLRMAQAYLNSVNKVASLAMIEAAKAHAQATIDFLDEAESIAGMAYGETLKINWGSKKIVVYEEEK